MWKLKNQISLMARLLGTVLIHSCGKRPTSPDSEDVPFRISDHILYHIFVKSIDFDSKGTAWIGTFKQGLVKYNKSSWAIINPVDENGESLGYVDELAVDLTGNIWASLWGRKEVVLALFEDRKWHLYN
jgi:hypothetical protein